MAIVIVEKNRYTVESLYQWDINQVLTVTGLSLPSTPEIHFTNEAMDRAIVIQATKDDAGVITADIPNSLLQKPYKISAYICIYEGDTFESLYSLEIPVKSRKKPGDYTFIDNVREVYSFNALENLVNNTVVNLMVKCDETIESVNKGYAEVIKNVTDTKNEAIDIIEETVNQARADLDVAGISEKAETAVAIAKGKNQAHVFSTTDAMITWLSNEENAGLWQVGDNIYIVDVGVPDWWISEVLTEADAETGYYYKIAQLETQKVDLTEIQAEIHNVDKKYNDRYLKNIDSYENLQSIIDNSNLYDMFNIHLEASFVNTLTGQSSQGVGIACKVSENILDMYFEVSGDYVYFVRYTSGNDTYTKRTRVALTIF